jgi:hypothetical protein
MILSTWPTPFPQKEQLTVFLGFFSKGYFAPSCFAAFGEETTVGGVVIVL